MSGELTYVVADIHGRFDLLTAALERIEAHAPEAQRRTIVFTGDYVDQGPQSREVLDLLMAGPPYGFDWICLKGNHEDLMYRALSGLDHADLWLSNGGIATLRSFNSLSATPEIDPVYLEWMNRLPMIRWDDHRVFVHAGVDPTIPLKEQTEHTLLWIRDQGPDGHGGRHVVHGHTPHRDGPKLFGGRTNLDTMAFYTGRLVVAVFDDDVPGPPVEFIEVRESVDA